MIDRQPDSEDRKRIMRYTADVLTTAVKALIDGEVKKALKAKQ